MGGPEDRTAYVRVKIPEKGGDPKGCYMELRSPSASACPYLGLAGLVASGLDGIQSKLELPPPRQTAESGAQPIPKTLEDALAALKADEYICNKLGEPFVRWYCGVKEAEIAQIKKEAGDDKALLSKAWQDMYLEYV